MSKVLLDSHNLNHQVTVYNNSTMPIYTVTIHHDNENGGYWATCEMPDGSANTIGNTLREVQVNMFESIDLYLEDYPNITDYILHFKVCDEFISTKEFLRLLVKYGCTLTNVKSSHFKVDNPLNGKCSTIPIHGNKDMNRGFLLNILKNQLGIDVDEFIKFTKNN